MMAVPKDLSLEGELLDLRPKQPELGEYEPSNPEFEHRLQLPNVRN
jgi:hypothetical protein